MADGSEETDEEEKLELQKIIEAFNYRVWISQLKYEEYVRLTVTSRDGLFTIEHVKYVMSLEDTWKYLIKKLIKPTVLVENYLMTSGTEPEIWPFGPTMRVANLRAEKRFWNSRDMLLLRDALSLESNFPLKSLETRPRRSAGELNDHLAQKFIINEAPNKNLIIKLKCPNVHFKDYTFDSIPFKIIFGILRKDPSKQYTFETSSPERVSQEKHISRIPKSLLSSQVGHSHGWAKWPDFWFGARSHEVVLYQHSGLN
ncbi:hypothetical protein GCK72_025984 [Caenorhabditis remanei]|uniref:Uncharacterized protein n=1 Tax=Caenorhabditis remanei TaxID=31234 RepID=A0A6A5G3N3_CAERE|nr:hypothetical protein GCK72_025984 [Caenorhabditis remanei]KAF1749516.1 hypothetical protein GCK72_025984 [Caenorhabditis remanei]